MQLHQAAKMLIVMLSVHANTRAWYLEAYIGGGGQKSVDGPHSACDWGTKGYHAVPHYFVACIRACMRVMHPDACCQECIMQYVI